MDYGSWILGSGRNNAPIAPVAPNRKTFNRKPLRDIHYLLSGNINLDRRLSSPPRSSTSPPSSTRPPAPTPSSISDINSTLRLHLHLKTRPRPATRISHLILAPLITLLDACHHHHCPSYDFRRSRPLNPGIWNLDPGNSKTTNSEPGNSYMIRDRDRATALEPSNPRTHSPATPSQQTPQTLKTSTSLPCYDATDATHLETLSSLPFPLASNQIEPT